jgi:hypothetical protein
VCAFDEMVCRSGSCVTSETSSRAWKARDTLGEVKVSQHPLSGGARSVAGRLVHRRVVLTATFVRESDGQRGEWAMGWSADVMKAALRPVIACVNRALTVA